MFFRFPLRMFFFWMIFLTLMLPVEVRIIPTYKVVVVAVALLYLQWLPAVRAVDEARGDPSTQAAFHQEVLDFLHDARAARASGSRCRSPATTGRRRTSREDYPLARGWHRQLDRKVNPLFYDPSTR